MHLGQDGFHDSPVNVVFANAGQIVVNNKRDLLNIDTTSQQIGGDQDTRRAAAELLHNHVTLALIHFTVHGGDGEVLGGHLLGQGVDLATGVAENDGLSDAQCVVQVAQCSQLPLLLLDVDVELTDTLQGQLLFLDQDADGVAHEVLADLQHLRWHGSRQEDDLHIIRQLLEDLLDLILETSRQHLISLVENEELDVVGAQELALDHVLNTTGSSYDNVHPLFEIAHVLADVGSTDASVGLGVHEVTQGNDDLLDLRGQLTSWGKDQSLAAADFGIDGLQDCNGERSRLTGT
jgi:hypothetical protein